MGKTALISVKLGVTSILIYLILRNIDLTEVIKAVSTVQPVPLLLACLVYPIGLVVSSIKLKWILQGYQMPVTVAEAIDVNWIAAFFNNFLPTSVGGDVYRVLYLNRSYPEKRAQVMSAVILDRGLGLLTMLILAGVTSVFFVGLFLQGSVALVVLYSGVIGIVLGVVLVLFTKLNVRLRHESKYGLIDKVIRGFNILVTYPDRVRLAYSLVMSFLFMTSTIVSTYLLFLAFDSDISLLVLLFVVPTVNLAGLIPMSINGIGITEGVGMFFFSHLGFEPAVVLSVLLTGRALLILCSATGGVRFLFVRNEVRPTKGTIVR